MKYIRSALILFLVMFYNTGTVFAMHTYQRMYKNLCHILSTQNRQTHTDVMAQKKSIKENKLAQTFQFSAGSAYGSIGVDCDNDTILTIGKSPHFISTHEKLKKLAAHTQLLLPGSIQSIAVLPNFYNNNENETKIAVLINKGSSAQWIVWSIANNDTLTTQEIMAIDTPHQETYNAYLSLKKGKLELHYRTKDDVEVTIPLNDTHLEESCQFVKDAKEIIIGWSFYTTVFLGSMAALNTYSSAPISDKAMMVYGYGLGFGMLFASKISKI